MIEGGIISGILGLVKEKEKQADKGLDRVHDSLKSQMESMEAMKGDWKEKKPQTSEHKIIKEKIIEKKDTENSAKNISEDQSDIKGHETNEYNNLDIFGLAKMAK